ncbi:hypothetical protein M0802_002924 [Mischocyttarus mexicanus]|nr:hypothetical protein M0802_002924 [Mischocyttarus mexicanus]
MNVMCGRESQFAEFRVRMQLGCLKICLLRFRPEKKIGVSFTNCKMWIERKKNIGRLYRKTLLSRGCRRDRRRGKRRRELAFLPHLLSSSSLRSGNGRKSREEMRGEKNRGVKRRGEERTRAFWPTFPPQIAVGLKL